MHKGGMPALVENFNDRKVGTEERKDKNTQELFGGKIK